MTSGLMTYPACSQTHGPTVTLDEPELQPLEICCDGVLQLTLPMREYDVVLVELGESMYR